MGGGACTTAGKMLWSCSSTAKSHMRKQLVEAGYSTEDHPKNLVMGEGVMNVSKGSTTHKPVMEV